MIGTIAYDNLGRRTSLTLGNGLATTYAYDTVSRLAQLKLELPGTTDDLTSSFTYNPASQIAKNVRSNDAYSWTGHGSGTTSTTSNGLNQIAGWVSTLGYDSKGNITSDGTYTYGYSSENLLTSLANSASGALQPTIAFAYDPLMRLAAIDSSNAVFDVQFGYDGQEMVYEGLSDNRTRRYVYGPGVDEPLVGYLVTPTGTSRLWYQADERGSIVRLSNDSGTGGIGRFDEYGVGGTSRFRYTGQYWLGEANLLYYRARVYDARLGRFLQPDPIGYDGGINLYAYANGDPMNFVDPSGLAPKKPPLICTGTRIQSNCGAGGGIASGLSGFTTAGVGGQVAGHFEKVNAGGPGRSVGSDIEITASIRWVPDNLITGLMPIPPAALPPKPTTPLPEQPDYCGSDEANLPEGAWPQACRKHDECYASNSSKDKCDRNFVGDIVADCSGRIYIPAACLVPAIVGGVIVTIFGYPAYKRERTKREERPR